MIDRQTTVARFLEANGLAAARRQPLAGDASARHYERLSPGTAALPASLILMDSPYPVDDVFPFLAVAGLLDGIGLSVPRIIAADPAQGLLVLEDFGDGTFSRLMDGGADPADLYRLATDLLIVLHSRFKPDSAATALPRYGAALFVDQVMLFADVYLPVALGRPLADADRAELQIAWDAVVSEAVVAVPASLLHRDFHVDNLMRLPDRAGVAACGILDFQSAGLGPITYDLVSLLEDARRDVPAAIASAMIDRYLDAFPALDRAAFRTSYAVLGAVRHARVIGIFARLALFQGRRAYLVHLPRVWRLLESHLGQPALAPVAAWFDRHLPAAARAAFPIPETVP